jgi:pimeloyl-ACP methyl ester carboxylesterase
VPAGPFAAEPLVVPSPDGTAIAVFAVRAAEPAEEPGDAPGDAPGVAHPPVLLVHGAAADHTTWRAAGPLLARTRRAYAMDRRGRGASGDGRGDYSIELEYDDVAAAAAALGDAVDVVGHSYGGRVALGASIVSGAVRKVVVYEGAPVPPGMSYRPAELVEAVREALGRGDSEAALATFLQGIVGLSDAAMDAYRREPVWPARVAAAPTILREIEAEAGMAASIEALRRATAQVLLLLGSASRSPFRIGTDALAAALPDARVHVIDGAAHAAHHTHVEAFVGRVVEFLDS